MLYVFIFAILFIIIIICLVSQDSSQNSSTKLTGLSNVGFKTYMRAQGTSVILDKPLNTQEYNWSYDPVSGNLKNGNLCFGDGDLVDCSVGTKFNLVNNQGIISFPQRGAVNCLSGVIFGSDTGVSGQIAKLSPCDGDVNQKWQFKEL